MSHDLRQSGQFCFQAAGALLKAVTHDLEELTSKTMKGTPASILYAFPVRHQPIFSASMGLPFIWIVTQRSHAATLDVPHAHSGLQLWL